MAIKTYRPYTPSRRAMTTSTYEEITKSTPEKSLLAPMKKTGGRNNQGKITCRHIGGGNKTRYRIIDFKRRKDNIPATVKAIEYDPNRNANIALICYADGVKAYIIEPQNLPVGTVIVSGESTDIKVGNCCELQNIPDGTFVHCVELQPGKGAQLCRAAGTSAQVLGSEGKYVTLRLASGEVRKILKNALIFTTLGIKRNLMGTLGLILLTAINLGFILLLMPTGGVIGAGLILPVLHYLAVAGFIKVYAAYPIIDRYMIAPYKTASETEKSADEDTATSTDSE